MMSATADFCPGRFIARGPRCRPTRRRPRHRRDPRCLGHDCGADFSRPRLAGGVGPVSTGRGGWQCRAGFNRPGYDGGLKSALRPPYARPTPVLLRLVFRLRLFLGRDPVLVRGPRAKIDALAARRAERPVVVLRHPLDSLAASRAGDDASCGASSVRRLRHVPHRCSKPHVFP